MTTGIELKEDYYLQFNTTAKVYYGKNIEKQMLSRKFISEPGQRFNYISSDTQLLAIILQRAVGISISQYLQEEFWQPMGMEEDAYWSKDRNDGMEKAYCCLYSNVREIGRLGQLLLQHGQ